MEPLAADALREGRLRRVLESYAAEVPGWFLYFPSRAQASPALRAFIDVARSVTGRGARRHPFLDSDAHSSGAASPSSSMPG
jgi:DNA-binding transcriptional LysR family regulator